MRDSLYVRTLTHSEAALPHEDRKWREKSINLYSSYPDVFEWFYDPPTEFQMMLTLTPKCGSASSDRLRLCCPASIIKK